MVDMVVFGGTTEGRQIAALLCKKQIPTLVCVASEYGEALLSPGEGLRVHTGRLDVNGMEELLILERPRLVIDATHPYATEVSGNICTACRALGIRYLRVCREVASVEDGCLRFSDMDALITWLNAQSGVVFSTLGAKEAAALTRVQGFAHRVWLRILPSPEGIRHCLHAGFPARHIICMQGPFSKELNVAMFHAAQANILITKESGETGGFAAKREAARECDMTVAVLNRPAQTAGISLDVLLQQIQEGRL